MYTAVGEKTRTMTTTVVGVGDLSVLSKNCVRITKFYKKFIQLIKPS